MERENGQQQSETVIRGNVIGSNIQVSGAALRVGGRITNSRIDGDVVHDQVVPRDR
jgi:hypothetical protein